MTWTPRVRASPACSTPTGGGARAPRRSSPVAPPGALRGDVVLRRRLPRVRRVARIGAPDRRAASALGARGRHGGRERRPSRCNSDCRHPMTCPRQPMSACSAGAVSSPPDGSTMDPPSTPPGYADDVLAVMGEAMAVFIRPAACASTSRAPCASAAGTPAWTWRRSWQPALRSRGYACWQRSTNSLRRTAGPRSKSSPCPVRAGDGISSW